MRENHAAPHHSLQHSARARVAGPPSGRWQDTSYPRARGIRPGAPFSGTRIPSGRHLGEGPGPHPGAGPGIGADLRRLSPTPRASLSPPVGGRGDAAPALGSRRGFLCIVAPQRLTRGAQAVAGRVRGPAREGAARLQTLQDYLGQQSLPQETPAPAPRRRKCSSSAGCAPEGRLPG